MDKDEALKRAQELLEYYGSGAYKGYEEVILPDGSPGVRFILSLPAHGVVKETDMYYIEVVTRFNLQLEGVDYFQNIKQIAQTRGFQIFTMDVAPEHINDAERVLTSEIENLNIVTYSYGIKE